MTQVQQLVLEWLKESPADIRTQGLPNGRKER